MAWDGREEKVDMVEVGRLGGERSLICCRNQQLQDELGVEQEIESL